ncbi:MAG: glycosyltransferase family 2 protein [Acidimicrobiia bacterium]
MMASNGSSPTPDLDVSAIIISYHSEGRIAEAVRANEEALAHLEAEIIVVDNNSADRSVEIAASAIRRGHVIANSDNVGYGIAANQGIAAARGRTALILNDDARLSPGAIDLLLAALDSAPEVALVGPRIVDEEGNPMPSARTVFPGPMEAVQRAWDVVRGVNRNNVYPTALDDPIDVAWLLGACLLGETETLRAVGGFNPDFFLYVEDIDLCRRLHEKGHRILTVPRAECVHTGSVSTGDAYSESVRMMRQANSRDIYYRIWYPRITRSLIHLHRAIGIRNQPWRIKYHGKKVFYDGPSLAGRRFPSALHDTENGSVAPPSD